MNIFGYIRESTDPSLVHSAQLNSINEFSLRVYGDEVSSIFTDDVQWGSVLLSERPGGSDLLDKVATGDVIIGLSLDRCFASIQQGMRLIDELLDRKIYFNIADLEYPLESGEGALAYETVKKWIQFDSKIKSERIKETAKPSRPTNRFSPVGYKIVRSEGESHFVPDNNERELVGRLIHWRDVDGETWSECLRRMQKEGTRAGNIKWNQTSIRVAYHAGHDGFPGSSGEKDGFTILERAKSRSKNRKQQDSIRSRRK